MTVVEVHSFTIATRTDKVFLNNPIRHRAECQCGWVCPEWRRSEGEAESDGVQHQAMTVYPPYDEAA